MIIFLALQVDLLKKPHLDLALSAHRLQLENEFDDPHFLLSNCNQLVKIQLFTNF